MRVSPNDDAARSVEQLTRPGSRYCGAGIAKPYTSAGRQDTLTDQQQARRRCFAGGLFCDVVGGRGPAGVLYFESSATSDWLLIASLASSPVSVFTTTVPSAET